MDASSTAWTCLTASTATTAPAATYPGRDGCERLLLMGRRLYRFGHAVFGIALLLGLLLTFGGRFLHGPVWTGPSTGWLHAKVGLVVVMLALFTVTGRWLKRAAAGGALPSARTLRWFNELPVIVLIGIVYLVLAKPF